MGRKTCFPYVKTPQELTDRENRLSNKAILLYVWLNQIEQHKTPNPEKDQYTRDWFLCTDKELCEYSGLSINTVKSAKKELKERGFITVGRGNWQYVNTGKSSLRQPCKYQIIK